MSQADSGTNGGQADSLSEEATQSGPASAPSALEVAVGLEAARRYEEALARLGPRDRDVVRGRVELQWSYRKLAEALGMTTAKARARVTRALRRLIEAMSE